jgi:hypothetical protein
MDFYSSRTNSSLILSVIGNIIEQNLTGFPRMMIFFSLFRVANRTFAATKGQMLNKNYGIMDYTSCFSQRSKNLS